jgi:hypothetical protein
LSPVSSRGDSTGETPGQEIDETAYRLFLSATLGPTPLSMKVQKLYSDYLLHSNPFRKEIVLTLQFHEHGFDCEASEAKSVHGQNRRQEKDDFDPTNY